LAYNESAVRQRKSSFDPHTFLSTIRAGQKKPARRQEDDFRPGRCNRCGVLYPEGQSQTHGRSSNGKEATIGILGDSDFFGEGCLAGQPLCIGSASAMTNCEILRIDKKAMMLALRREHKLSDMFVAYLLARNIRYQEDLVDQLFNFSEKRLARILLLLAHFGKEVIPQTVVPEISQTTLAEMVGTARSRVNFFMNRFRNLGFIHYSGGQHASLQIHSSLLSVVLHD
jgi:CRP/FNR family cyclic AMP-dependent transcriptional regulator